MKQQRTQTPQTTGSTTTTNGPQTQVNTANSQVQSTMTTGGSGGLSALDQARADNPVTLDDYCLRSTGEGEDALDVAGATTADSAYSAMELSDWEDAFAKAEVAMANGTKVEGKRTEEEMLAAIKANTAPRFLARVGPKVNFTKWNSFGRPNEFIFATEPADLIGCTAIEAMIKVGWGAEDIKKHAANQQIAVSILDTSKAVPKQGATNGETTNIDTGRMEWPDLKAKAMGDSDFKKDLFDRLSADNAVSGMFGTQGDLEARLSGIFDVAADLPVGQSPSSPSDKVVHTHLREALSDNYGANQLYSGMGATIDEQGNLGAREVMVNNNESGFPLTPDNHTLIDIGPIFTPQDVDRALTPPPTSGS